MNVYNHKLTISLSDREYKNLIEAADVEGERLEVFVRRLLGFQVFLLKMCQCEHIEKEGAQ